MTLRSMFFSFRGRVRRRDYWLGMLAVALLVAGIPGTLALILQKPLTEGGGDTGAGWASMFGILTAWAAAGLIALWPQAALAVKRAHDRGRGGVFILLLLVPVLNLWPLIELAFLDGTPGDNAFGPSPKTPGASVLA